MIPQQIAQFPKQRFNYTESAQRQRKYFPFGAEGPVIGRRPARRDAPARPLERTFVVPENPFEGEIR